MMPPGMEKVGFGPDASIPGYVAGPKGGPALIVIQEWWGVTDEIVGLATRFASEGAFRVLVPDLYKGKLGADKEEAHHLMGALDFPGAVKEICHAAAHLKAEGAAKVGIVGFCMGGALTLGGAAASPDIACAAPFYGCNFGLFEPAQLKDKPICGHFGEEDAMAGFSDPETARKLEAVLKEAGNTQATVTVHPTVGHAFMNKSPAPFASFEDRKAQMGMPPYNEKVAEAAWDTTMKFFAQHLK
mmetsp:Transcript_9540/g.27910  ORF Transcript_9540/g.27910 Transcript_9540/m.27910 type:complete len:243 (-) Transcript_9540:541-1269(-)